MLWPVDGKPVRLDRFDPLRLSRVLNEYDGPRIFTLENEEQELFFACFSDEAEDTECYRFVVVPFSDVLLKRLTTGTISLYQALEQPRVWLVDVSHVWKPLNAWRTSLDRIPADCLPDKSVMIWPSLEPIISIRSVGDTIGEGTTPASVVADVVEGVKAAMRILVQQVREEIHSKTSAAVRRLYDLPTQKFAFNSFEVAFRLPAEEAQSQIEGMQPDTVAAIYHDVGHLLNRGIEWLLSGSRNPMDMKVDDKDRGAVLEALEKLIPSYIGPVKSLEIGGQLVAESQLRQGKPIQINRDAKTVVRSARKTLSMEDERVLKGVGYIRELDKDRYTFELRDDGGRTIGKFSFDQDIADDVDDAHYNAYPVEVLVQSGRSKTMTAKIVQRLDIAPSVFSIEAV